MAKALRVTTTTLLLESLKDPSNLPVWEEFDARYRPVLVGFARHLGASAEDAEDVAQTTLVEFIRQYRAGKYERGRGRLSSWILTIARYRVADTKRGKARRQEFRGESAIVDLPRDDEVQTAWDTSRRRAIIALALQSLREKTKIEENNIRAFELVAIRGMPAEEVAKDCGLSVDQVYVAKNRVTAKLRQYVEEMTKAFEEE